MKKTFILTALLALAGLVSLQSFYAMAQNKYTIGVLMQSTRDQTVLDAFSHMQNNSAEGALDTIVTKKTRVFFKDLRQINHRVKDYDALSWISPKGEWVIFINKKHKNAPPEAIASVIAHEAVHNDPHNSMNEEIVAWHQEAKVWMEFKKQNPQLASIPSGLYPLVDRLNELEKSYTNNNLERLVRENKGYRGLADTSPGFMETHEVAKDPYLPKKNNPKYIGTHPNLNAL